MSLQPSHDLLPTLRAMRDKIERAPRPLTPSLTELYIMIVHRIAALEALHAPMRRGSLRVS